MNTSKPNENGVLEEGRREIVARHGRACAVVNIARCEDGRYRHGMEMWYSHGGFSSPISAHSEGFATIGEARRAGLEDLLRQWHEAWPSEPKSVHDELRVMREQIEAQLCQPSLF